MNDRLPDERALARVDEFLEPSALSHRELASWCDRWLGAPPAHVLFAVRRQSFVVGLELSDGRRVVVKARRPAPRIDVGVRLQRRLFSRGFPCPAPLAGPTPLGPLAVTAEAFVEGGEALERNAWGREEMAAALARLIALAPPAATLEAPTPTLAWVGWGHADVPLWPHADGGEDLNETSGPRWLDDLMTRTRQRLRACSAPEVIAHGDWESQNMGWQGGSLHVVYDWDSVLRAPEAVAVGTAAAIFPRDRLPAAYLQDSARFLEVYAIARGTSWTSEELEVCWAASLWVMAFNAKEEMARGEGRGDGPATLHLQAEAAPRLRAAGIA